MLHLKNPDMLVVRLTGVYFSPVAKPGVEHVKMLTDARFVVRFGGNLIGHTMGGEFNYPSGSGEYE